MQELAQMKQEAYNLAKQKNPMKKEEFIIKGGQSLPYATEFEQLQMNYEDRNAVMEEIIKERKRYYYIQNKKKRWRKELIKLGPDGIPEEEKLRLEAMNKSVKNEEELAEMMKRPKRVWYTRYQFFKRIKEGKELSKRNRSWSAIGSERIQHMQAAKCLANATLGPNNNLYNSRQRWRRPDLKPVWMYDKHYRNSKIQALRNNKEQEEKENEQRKQDYSEENEQNLTGYAKRGGQSYKFNNYRDGNKRQKVNERDRWYN